MRLHFFGVITEQASLSTWVCSLLFLKRAIWCVKNLFPVRGCSDANGLLKLGQVFDQELLLMTLNVQERCILCSGLLSVQKTET